MRRVVGLTGMTGSGKSTICEVMESMGAHILGADEIAKSLQQPGQKGYISIGAHFGNEYLLPDGLDRKKLASLVFNDREKLGELNAIMFPLITEEIITRLEKMDGLCIIDAALLFEADMERVCDEVWIAQADDDVRLRRIMARDGLGEKQARERMGSQRPVPVKGAVILDTTDGMEALMPKLRQLYCNRG